MKALVKSKPEKGIWMEEVPVPHPGPNDVLIKISKSAVCGTDLHIYKWDEWAQGAIKTPVIIGHEYMGHVVEIGDEVQGVQIGERVTVEGHIACGYCRNCRRGRQHICDNTIGIGVSRDGGFAEYLAVPAKNVLKIDSRIPDEILAIMDPLGREKFDRVCNLAAQAGVRYSLENPKAYIDSNIHGFLSILEAARKYQVEHLVYASSSSVYGNSPDMPLSTDQRTDSPVSLYAATKKSNELMAYTYGHLFGIPSTGLRFFTVYGPWGRPDMAYFSFTRNILAGKPIKVFNQGDLYRDFTYIDDIIEGVVRVIDKVPVGLPPVKVYNIGHSDPVRLDRFIGAIETALGKEALKEYFPMQPGDVYKTYADVTALENDLEYHPSTSIETGIQKFVAWYRAYYHSS